MIRFITETPKRLLTYSCIYVMLTNQQNAHFKNSFYSILLALYVFRTSYVHLQEDYAALCVMFSMLKLQ
jgi:hypothetical protein